MADYSLQHRQSLYFDLSSRIALLDNVQLRSLFGDSEEQSSYGTNHTVTLGRSKVFVKRVPVTDLEYDNMFSTRNMYDLPTFYNYGFGSAGLGVFRELVTHIKTTNWVLSGAIATFPLMYHYRLIPFSGAREEVDMERHALYVTYWGSNANVERYMLDRASAKYELVLFLEHFPHTVAPWLLANPAKLPLVVADTHSTLTFLRNNGILHLDAHFNNMVTDGKHIYLTDFGLALDKHFDLSPAEQEFYRQHSYYDFGYLLWNLGFPLFRLYRNLPDADKDRLIEQYGITPHDNPEVLMSHLLANGKEIIRSDILHLNRGYRELLVKYLSMITFMHTFYMTMRRNDSKDTPFDHAKLRRLLKEVEFLPGPLSNS